MEYIDFEKGTIPDTHQILVQITARDLKRVMVRIVNLTLEKERYRVKSEKHGNRKI